MSDHLVRQLYSNGEDSFVQLQASIPNPTVSGPQGPMGPQGPAGSDATVNKANVQAVLNEGNFLTKGFFKVEKDSQNKSAIESHGAWHKYMFLFAHNSTLTSTQYPGTSQLMTEMGRVGETEGFTYIKNTNANNTLKDLPEPNGSEVRIYDDVHFEFGPAAKHITLDPKTLEIKAKDGEAEHVIKIAEYETKIATLENDLADLKAYVATLNTRMHALENPVVTQLAVMPAAGTHTVAPGESFSITVDPEGQDFYALEVDHNLAGILPEFTVYASEANPYGTQQSKAQFEALGASITYNAAEMKWTLNFGPAITDIFRAQANVKFYFVVRDSLGNIVWGSMNPSTPENTRQYVIV